MGVLGICSSYLISSEGYKEKIHILHGNKEYLQKQIKEQEKNLSEPITT